MKLATVMVSSENPNKLVDFYTKVLGKPSFDSMPFTGWMTNGAVIMVGPHSEVKGKNDMPGRLITMFETEDVKGEFDRIKAAGAEVVSEPTNPDSSNKDIWLACLADPDGNYFQLVSPFDPTNM